MTGTSASVEKHCTQFKHCKNQTFITNIIPLNGDEFILCGDKKSYHKTFNISKYNTKTNKWTHITINDPYSTGITLGSHSISIDSTLTKLFSCGTDGMSVIDIKNLKLTKKLSLPPTNGNGKYLNCSSLMINNKYHIIGGIKNKKHLIWNNQENRFDEIYNFPHVVSGLQHSGFVYVKSKQICLLFGGHDCVGMPWWRSDPCKDIWILSLHSNEWKKSEIQLPVHCRNFGYCLTKNERFILLFGDGHDMEKIYIWDLQSMTFRKSVFKCPIKCEFRAVAMYDKSMEVVLLRMIRNNCCKHNIFPNDIIGLIEYWIGIECVYLIDYLLGSGWKVNLHDVLFQIDDK